MRNKEPHSMEELKECVAYRDEQIAKATPGTREHTEPATALAAGLSQLRM